MNTPQIDRHTDHVVRYQNGLACLTSVSLEDAETVARLLREEGVADVRVFRRVTETRETEVGASVAPGPAHTPTPLESTCNDQYKRIIELNRVVARMEAMLCRCMVNEEPPSREELDAVQESIRNLGVS